MTVMTWLFLTLATVGGTILICQFVLTLIGLGHDAAIVDDLPDDVPHEFGHLGDAGHGHADAAGGAGHEIGADAAGHAGHAAHHSGAWLVGIISFRTLVAAAAFFGLAGLAAEAAELSHPLQLVIASASGWGAMYGVHWLMQTISRLGEDPTVRVQRAVGLEGSVYVPIPAGKRQPGKVQLSLQGRLMELEAVTTSDYKLPTGAKVRVVALEGRTLVVEPLAGGRTTSDA